MKRLLIAGLCLAALAGCASTGKKLAECNGKYEPINAPDKYPTPAPTHQGKTP